MKIGIVLILLYCSLSEGQTLTEIECSVNYHFAVAPKRRFLEMMTTELPRWKNGTAQKKVVREGAAENNYPVLKAKGHTICLDLIKTWKALCKNESRRDAKLSGKASQDDCRRGFVLNAELGNSYWSNGYFEVENKYACNCIMVETTQDAKGCDQTTLISSYPLKQNFKHPGE